MNRAERERVQSDTQINRGERERQTYTARVENRQVSWDRQTYRLR